MVVDETVAPKLSYGPYKALVVRVVDGDTFECLIDTGFDIKLREMVRLLGVDTPETYRPRNDAEAAHGQAATKFVKDWMEGQQVIIRTHYNRQGKYGRVLADVWHPHRQRWLSDELVARDLVKRDSYP